MICRKTMMMRMVFHLSRHQELRSRGREHESLKQHAILVQMITLWSAHFPTYFKRNRNISTFMPLRFLRLDVRALIFLQVKHF